MNGPTLSSNEDNIEKEGCEVFHKVFVAGCLKQFDSCLRFC